MSHTNEPYNNIQASVFGFPMNSTFLQFVFESAKINSLREDYKNLFVFEKYGPPFFTTMFVKFNDSNINMIHQEYLVQNTSASVMFQVRFLHLYVHVDCFETTLYIVHFYTYISISIYFRPLMPPG